jgi:hypothetical protein
MPPGGKRQGAGRKKIERPEEVRDKGAAARIINALNRKPDPKEPYEIQKFREIDNAGPKESRELREWLYDKRDGKAAQLNLNANVRIDNTRRQRIRDLITRLAGSPRG